MTCQPSGCRQALQTFVPRTADLSDNRVLNLAQQIEAALAELRWNAETADCDALLRKIGAFPSYWIVLADGEMATAPDDDHARILAAVFTSEPSRDLFVHSLTGPTETLEMTGRELFAQLGSMRLNGIVFNCLGPGRPIAFIPELVHQVKFAVAADFDELVRIAFPNGQTGTKSAMSVLWRAAFALPEWLFIVDPRRAGDPKPYITTEAGHVCVFAFTDGVRARRFAVTNELLGADGNAVILSMTPVSVLRWAADELRLHMNFGRPGWFSPLPDLPRIYEYIQRPTGEAE